LKRPEYIFAIWSLLALASLIPVTILLNGAFPFFTVIWILIPLIIVLKTKDGSRVGFLAIPWRECISVTIINLIGLMIVMLIVEPWSHTYRMLLNIALSGQNPDTTFAWILRFQRLPALGGMTMYSGFVTLFAEELFFRGWLLQLLQKRWGALRAIVAQAFFFLLPNLLVALVLPPLQGVLYTLVYTWLAIGLIGGWAASRTKSIWPSLISATMCNLILVAILT
jgi:membrane protease YdiL (CAAX protease family)